MSMPTARCFQSAADSSGIIFTPDIFNMEAQRYQRPPPPPPPQRHKSHHSPESSERSKNGAPTKNVSGVASFLHPALRRRPVSGSAGDVGVLDDTIARNGGTTSTYEQLPHRLRISKLKPKMSAGERVVELTRINGHLLQELAYYKDTRAADIAFYEKIIELHITLRDAVKERSRGRVDAEQRLLNYWGINFNDGNIEDKVF